MNQNILALWRQPFPLDLPGAAAVRLRVVIAFLVYFILLVFQPFGLADCHHHYLPLDLLGYGIITFGVQSFFEVFIQRKFSSIFKDENWTVGKAILWTWCIISVIGIFNALYHWQLDCTTFSIIDSVQMVINTSLVGIFPFAVTIVGRFAVLYHRYKERAESLSALKPTEVDTREDHTIALFQDNRKSKILLRTKDILLIEAAENYVVVYSLVNHHLKKDMVRSTLQSAQESIDGTFAFVRCHRSYIVNLALVSKLYGNAQGYKLQIELIDKVIPVSRKYEKSVVEKLQLLKNMTFPDYPEKDSALPKDIPQAKS